MAGLLLVGMQHPVHVGLRHRGGSWVTASQGGRADKAVNEHKLEAIALTGIEYVSGNKRKDE